MSLSSRQEIATRLVARSWSPSTPAAIVLGAHTARQWSWTGPLAALGAVELPPERADLPGLVVIGDVVAIAERIAPDAKLEDHLAIA
jgi:siroheme synthase